MAKGKLSEGINLSGDLCRGVLVIGLPLPNFDEPKIKLKRGYIDARRSGGLSTGPTGMQCIQQQAMRSVNQGIGRAIRDKSDFGAIILLDKRFQQRENMRYLSGWVKDSIHNPQSYADLRLGLGRFFGRHRAQHPAVEHCPQNHTTTHPVSTNASIDEFIPDVNIPSNGCVEKSIGASKPSINQQRPSGARPLWMRLSKEISDVDREAQSTRVVKKIYEVYNADPMEYRRVCDLFLRSFRTRAFDAFFESLLKREEFDARGKLDIKHLELLGGLFPLIPEENCNQLERKALSLWFDSSVVRDKVWHMLTGCGRDTRQFIYLRQLIIEMVSDHLVDQCACIGRHNIWELSEAVVMLARHPGMLHCLLDVLPKGKVTQPGVMIKEMLKMDPNGNV